MYDLKSSHPMNQTSATVKAAVNQWIKHLQGWLSKLNYLKLKYYARLLIVIMI